VVFTQASILAPVEPIFDTSPVTSDGVDPLLREMGVVGAIADVIAVLIEGDAITGAEVMDTDRATGMGEVDLHGFDGR
jgi:hypothetical protein